MKIKNLVIAAAMAVGLSGAAATGASAANLFFNLQGSAHDGSFYLINQGAGPFYSIYGASDVFAGDTIVNIQPTFLFADGLSGNINYLRFAGATYPPLQISIDPSTGGGLLTITAVPESSVWVMLMAGLAMIGTALRFSRKPAGAAIAA